MKKCSNCGHFVRRKKGILLHRMEHSKYPGVAGGGCTFNVSCLNPSLVGFKKCGCMCPEVEEKQLKKKIVEGTCYA